MRTKQTDIEICRELKSRLSREVPLVSLELFGSRARGEEEPESDFDFLVVVEKTDSDVRRKIHDIAWEVAFQHNTVFQTVIMTQEQLTTRPERFSLLVREVRREGIKI